MVSEERGGIIAQVILSNSTFIYAARGLLSVHALLQRGTASHLHRYIHTWELQLQYFTSLTEIRFEGGYEYDRAGMNISAKLY